VSGGGPARAAGRILSRSARSTHALGRRLGALLADGDVVALVGDLGAGKTQLVRGLCAGAGVAAGDVSSPTFAIVATYRGRLPVHHADLYRLADLDELEGTGLTELVGGLGALVVEWADRVEGWMPAERLLLTLWHVARAPAHRRIEVDGVGERHAALARALLESRSGSRSAPRSTRGPAAPTRVGPARGRRASRAR
jgi:tRNA threonylcarbamoyladenosine biosynthesis protein TsaE